MSEQRNTRPVAYSVKRRIQQVVGQALKDIYPGIDMIEFIWLAQKVYDFLLDCCEDEFLEECAQEEEPVAFNACFNLEAVISYLRDNQEWIYEKAPSLKELQKGSRYSLA